MTYAASHFTFALYLRVYSMRLIHSICLAFLMVAIARANPPLIKDIGKGQQPQLAIDADGNIELVCGREGSIYFANSTDAGDTFSKLSQVARLQKLSLGMRRGPRIAAQGRMLVVTAIGSSNNDLQGDLLAWKSGDFGKTWVGPARVNDVGGSAKEGLHGMCSGTHGVFYCVWLDLRTAGTKIFSARSNDAGETWSKNNLVYESPGGSVCECCHPSIAVDKNGKVYVMWRNSLDGNRDMYFATSTDGGETFAPAGKLGTGSWQLGACPMDGGALAVSPFGGVFSAWRRERAVFIASPSKTNERRIGDGSQPWLTADADGAHVVWLGTANGQLFYADSPQFEPIELSNDARFPVIASGGGKTLVSWESGAAGKPVINIAVINSR